MADYTWPEPEKRNLIGKRVSRVDGPFKVSGRAKYSYDINRPGMLYGKMLRCPHAHARVLSIDTSGAQKMPGVKVVKVIETVGGEIKWAGDTIAGVAAVDEPTAEDAIRAIKVQYEVLPHLVTDTDPKAAGEMARPAAATTQADPDKAFAQAEVVSEGFYGLPVITHCCLESHGLVAEWEDEQNMLIHPSTQAVAATAGELAKPLDVPATNIHVKQDHIGGGFGSKLGSADSWGVECARMSKLAGGKPVKVFLERSAELMVAGCRPSAYARVKLGAMKDGSITAWQSESWGTGGMGGGGSPPLPYIFNIPNQRKQHTAIANNIGSARAWRAPNHPQACLITMAALEDLAAKLNMNPLDFFLKNIELTRRPQVYRDELKIAADLIDWEKNWHPRGDRAAGPIKRGLGLAIHTWGGGGHPSNCDLTIHPDGSVELKMATQDLGTGTRTAVTIVAADTLGLPMNAIKLMIGDNRYPASGASGGSSTIAGVSASTRRAAVDALEQLLAKVAPALNAQPGDLEAVGGMIRVKNDPGRSISWAQACSKLGVTPINVLGKNPDRDRGKLNDQGVGGCQMADVSVDVETGVVKINKIVAVQDCGLIIDLKTAESQVYGALIMGVSYALYEEKIMDQQTGRMLNPNMEFYRLAGLGDIGELVVHMMTDKAFDERGVIGLGEPPVISPGAAISNAVANAIGVRVPTLPLTPDRVLAALERKGGNDARI